MTHASQVDPGKSLGFFPGSLQQNMAIGFKFPNHSALQLESFPRNPIKLKLSPPTPYVPVHSSLLYFPLIIYLNNVFP